MELLRMQIYHQQAHVRWPVVAATPATVSSARFLSFLFIPQGPWQHHHQCFITKLKSILLARKHSSHPHSNLTDCGFFFFADLAGYYIVVGQSLSPGRNRGCFKKMSCIHQLLFF
jgi:hypothetical protein